MADYATLLRDHTTLTCRSVDRIFLQGYVPGLQSPGQVARFLLQRGFPFPSSAALGLIGDRYVDDIKRWAKAEGVPIHYFKKGEKKEAIAEPLFRCSSSATSWPASAIATWSTWSAASWTSPTAASKRPMTFVAYVVRA